MPAVAPEELLDQAYRLIGDHRRRGARQADLRRAISASYYGVFHLLASACADRMIGPEQRSSPLYGLVYRGIDHRNLFNLCAAIARGDLPPRLSPYGPSGGFSPPFRIFAADLTELQRSRHAADYDPSLDLTATDTSLWVDKARDAIQSWTTLPASERDAFVVLLLFQPR